MTVSPIECTSAAWTSACCLHEVCALCSQQAYAKVVEEIFADDPFRIRHALTAYVCVSHFQQLMGHAGMAHVQNYRKKMCGSAQIYSDDDDA